jgi:HD-GYP domain-containing protein (c-di-GMP phosphodiesterase class II)
VTKNRSQILAALESGKSTDMANYLPRHNTEVCILSLCIGNLLKYNSSALNELGASALLHEAGMVKLPSEIYLTQEELGKKERQALGMHPLLGYQVLRHYNVPDGVCRPALEHHERQNGSGYPRKLHGNAITFNSRIIALCCAYEAMGAKRPYRDPQDSHRSLMELLQNPDNEFDPAVLKSLTSVLSLYPVGTLVMLSNGRQARVLASNTATPRYPLVQYLDGKEEIIKTEEYGISVARPLLPNERKV